MHTQQIVCYARELTDLELQNAPLLFKYGLGRSQYKTAKASFEACAHFLDVIKTWLIMQI